MGNGVIEGEASSDSGGEATTQDGVDDSSGSGADTDRSDLDDTVGVIGDGTDGDCDQLPGFGVAIVSLLSIVGIGYRLAPVSAS